MPAGRCVPGDDPRLGDARREPAPVQKEDRLLFRGEGLLERAVERQAQALVAGGAGADPTEIDDLHLGHRLRARAIGQTQPLGLAGAHELLALERGRRAPEDAHPAGAVGAHVTRADRDPANEPPLQFDVKIDGKTYVATSGDALAIQVGGKQVELLVTERAVGLSPRNSGGN